MTACITGATGFIGSHLVDALLAEGTHVRALVRRTSNLRWLQGKSVELVEGDIRDPISLRRFVDGADEVYHAAGLVKARSRDEYFEANVRSTGHLLNAVRSAAPSLRRFLFLSSQTAAGPADSPDHPVTEDMPCRPITAYGASKRAAEEWIRSSADGIPWTIVRPPAVFGPRDTEILIYFRTLAAGLNTVIGFREQRLNLIYVADLVEGILRAARSDRAVAQTYFIASERNYSWREVGEAAVAILGKRSIVVSVPHAFVHVAAFFAQTAASLQGKAATLNIEKARDLTRRYWLCDAAKARKELSFRERYSLEDALRETIAWYRSVGWIR
ncbi:MAG: NAD-dependent epimerase/dehydratase family protein [Bacteroidota bacterium]|nr:NAD-dependent epimerase/dehydratase family protein [Bacteroidota bacterium]